MPHPARRATVRALYLVAAAALLVLCAAASAPAATTWLCSPSQKHDPCDGSLRTTRISATGASLGTFTPASAKKPKVDCFYVYPTVSDQPGDIATKEIDPEQRSIALYQAAR